MEIIDNRVDTAFGPDTFVFLYYKSNKTDKPDFFARVCTITDFNYGLVDLHEGHMISSGAKTIDELNSRMFEAFGRIEFIHSSRVKMILT